MYADIPLSVFQTLAERLALCPTAPPFAAVETTIETTAGALHYGALLSGNRVRVIATPGPVITIRDVLRAPAVAVADLSRVQRTLIYDALSAWYVGRLVAVGLRDTIDA
jgi:hypothetical protein